MRGIRSREGGRGMSPDVSSIPFLVEEFLGLGARWVVLSASPREGSSPLPKTLERFVKLRSSNDFSERADAFMKPVASAVGHAPAKRYIVVQEGSNTDALLKATSALGSWLEGHQRKSQITLSLVEVRKVLRQLTHACEGASEARARVAMLRGIFNGYRRITTDALIVKHGAHAEFLDAFGELVDDAAYQEFSAGTLELGWRTRTDIARRRIERGVRGVLRKRAFRGMLGLGRRVMSTQTSGVDLVGSELAEDQGYAPSVALVGPALRRALKRWSKARPEFEPLEKALPSLGYSPVDEFGMYIDGRLLTCQWVT